MAIGCTHPLYFFSAHTILCFQNAAQTKGFYCSNHPVTALLPQTCPATLGSVPSLQHGEQLQCADVPSCLETGTHLLSISRAKMSSPNPAATLCPSCLLFLQGTFLPTKKTCLSIVCLPCPHILLTPITKCKVPWKQNHFFFFTGCSVLSG